MQEYDLVVIGGGSGGVRAARVAADHGARVAICEEYRYGGTCVIRGCVPKKLMVYAAHYHEDFIDSQHFGWQSKVEGFDWTTFINNKDQEIDRLNKIYEKLLTNAGVDILYGTGSLVDQNTVSVDGQNITAKTILIASGGTPFIPKVPGVEHAISSNEAFYLKQKPQTAVVVGGGYIAVEFAGIFNGLGCTTHLCYRGEQILRGFDHDLRDHLAQEVQKKGINLHLNTDIEQITLTDNNQKQILLNDGSTLSVDCVMYATGRKPNTQALNLAAANIKTGRGGEILVDKNSRTNVSNIYAVGDVTNRIALTPVATMEGHAFADTQFGNRPRLADHSNVPSAIFSQPPLATVGLSEQQARATYSNIATYSSEFRTLKHSLTTNEERSLMKLIVNADSDTVIGAHMIGTDAAEIMQGIAIAIKAGAKKADFDSTVGIHPSSAEEFCTMRTPN